jgi:hypothetical protein
MGGYARSSKNTRPLWARVVFVEKEERSGSGMNGRKWRMFDGEKVVVGVGSRWWLWWLWAVG